MASVSLGAARVPTRATEQVRKKLPRLTNLFPRSVSESSACRPRRPGEYLVSNWRTSCDVELLVVTGENPSTMGVRKAIATKTPDENVEILIVVYAAYFDTNEQRETFSWLLASLY
jgi:hypothetical protein